MTNDTAAQLRASCTADIAAIEAAQARLDAQGLALAEQHHVLLAECGMVVRKTEQGTFRLWGTAPDLSNAWRMSASEARIMARRWNDRMTDEQRAARCAVHAVPVETALGQLRADKLAILEAVNAAAD